MDEKAIARRRDVAALSDWQARLEQICALIVEVTETESSEAVTTSLRRSGC